MRTKSMIQEYQELYETKLPTRFEVCDRCSGHGTHVNPAIDGHGVTADEWNDWGEESQSMYLSGGYDVSCHECDGMRVVLIVVEDSLNEKDREQWTNHVYECYAYEAERLAEERMGC